jgi:hypothetical protein
LKHDVGKVIDTMELLSKLLKIVLLLFSKKICTIIIVIKHLRGAIDHMSMM